MALATSEYRADCLDYRRGILFLQCICIHSVYPSPFAVHRCLQALFERAEFFRADVLPHVGVGLENAVSVSRGLNCAGLCRMRRKSSKRLRRRRRRGRGGHEVRAGYEAEDATVM